MTPFECKTAIEEAFISDEFANLGFNANCFKVLNVTFQSQEMMLQDKNQIIKTKQPSDTATAGNISQEEQMDKIKCGFTASSKFDSQNSRPNSCNLVSL